MFIVNNEILTKQNNPETWNWYRRKVNQIQKDKKMYSFTGFKFHRYEKTENGKKVKMKRFKSIPTFSTIDNTELKENQTWIYVPSANSIRNENGLVRVLNPKPFMISESTNYDSEKDADIIFFLMYISEALRSKRIFLIDHEAEYIAKAEERGLAAEAQYLIFNSQSPINEETLGTDEVYRQLAIAYGVSGSRALHIAELKDKLWNNLVSLNKTRSNAKLSYKQFINDCYNSTNNEMRSTILIAIERGIIYYEKNGWYIKIRGQYDELVVRVAPNEEINKKDILINYLVQHNEYLMVVKEAIDNSVERLVKEKPEDEETDPDKMLRSQMIKKLIALGMNNKEVFGMATDDMRIKLKKAMSKQDTKEISE